MPVALLVIGAVFVIVAVNGHGREFFSLLKGDFTGPDNFLFWLVVLFMIGAIGYIDELEPLADGFFVIVILALLLARQKDGRGGFFGMLQSQVNESQTK